jgi:hypothetical protein
MQERRNAHRTPVRLLVQHQLESGESFDIDYATDVSPGGLFISSTRRPAQDATLHVQFSPLRDANLVSAFCRVTHVTPHGFGAQFVGLDAESATLLQGMVG